MIQDKFKIISIEKNNCNMYDFSIKCPEIAKLAKPGQFVHIRCDGFSLRRPISICSIDKDNSNIRIIFQIRGNGTDWLAQQNVGDFLDILGPLGNGFNVSNPNKTVLIGGGIGVPPMLGVAQALGENSVAILGFRDSDSVILEKDFSDVCKNTIICTDDGSYGEHGFVSSALTNYLIENSVDTIYACGPMAMLKSINNIANEYNIRCDVSLEERMGCGVGACLVCACKVNVNGSDTYKHVCKDGPVFNAREVVFGE